MSETNRATGAHTGDDQIDRAWWADILEIASAEAASGSANFLSIGLSQIAARAVEESGAGSLRSRTLTALARAASPVLEPGDWASPFRPMAQWEGRRSAMPEDLSPQEFTILAQVAPMLELPTLRARAADMAWTYGDRSNQAMIDLAIASYLAVPLAAESWAETGRDEYRRALELALRRGKAATNTIDALAAKLLAFVLTANGSETWVVTQVSELLAKTRRASKPQAQQVAHHLVELAGTATPNVGRSYLRQAAAWLRGISEAQANETLETVAELYVEEVELRLRADDGALVASLLLEKAIRTLRDLPRKYRASRNLEPWLAQLRASLADIRKLSIEEMNTISLDPIDITTFVTQSREQVAGVDRLEALVRLAEIASLIDAKSALNEEQESSANSFAQSFDNITLSTDARKVGAQNGTGGRNLTADETLNAVVSTFNHRIGLVVQAQIYPALSVVVFEHRHDLDYLTRLCFESPTVPSGHEGLWAAGLRHGLAGDFPTAISILVPQIEQMVRRHFKESSVFTLYVADDGVETEKSLGALLEMPDANRLLGPNLTLELRALLCEQLGPNLRNDLAHGLLTDLRSWSPAAVYAWWHCLRLVVIPYYYMVQDLSEANSKE